MFRSFLESFGPILPFLELSHVLAVFNPFPLFYRSYFMPLPLIINISRQAVDQYPGPVIFVIPFLPEYLLFHFFPIDSISPFEFFSWNPIFPLWYWSFFLSFVSFLPSWVVAFLSPFFRSNFFFFQKREKTTPFLWVCESFYFFLLILSLQRSHLQDGKFTQGFSPE